MQTIQIYNYEKYYHTIKPNLDVHKLVFDQMKIMIMGIFQVDSELFLWFVFFLLILYMNYIPKITTDQSKIMNNISFMNDKAFILTLRIKLTLYQTIKLL